MIGTRRLAVIEDEPNKDPDSIIKLQEKIRVMQRKVLGEIYQSISPTGKRHHILEKMDKWVLQNLLTESKSTFRSIESIDQVMDSIIDKLKTECKKVGVKNSHAEFGEGLILLLQWYRILAIDAFLQTKNILIDEIENKESEDQSADSVILHKKRVLAKKIKSFNMKLDELEGHALRQKNVVLALQSDEWRNTFNAMIKEEKLLLSSPQIIFLENERNMLETSVQELKNETALVVEEFKSKLLAEKANRLKNQDVTVSDLDAYFVQAFAELHPNVFQNYKALFTSIKPKKLEKIAIVESTIAQLKTPLKEFNIALHKFHQQLQNNLKKTFGFAMTRYQTSISEMYSLLKEKNEKFTSPILVIDKEYEGQCRYINDSEKGLPAIKREVEIAYHLAAIDFVGQIIKKPSRHMAAKEEADKNFRKEILQFAQSLAPVSNELDIQPIRLGDLYKENMNASWLNVFNQYFKKELDVLKLEFNRIKFDKTEHIKEKVTKLREDFFAKKELLLREVVREDRLKQRYGAIFGILNNALDHIKLDPVFQEIEDCFTRIQKEKERDEQIKAQQKTNALAMDDIKICESEMLMKPTIKPEFLPVVVHRSISLPTINEEKSAKKPSVKMFEMMPLWQRMVIGGLASLAWMAVAFTIWGLLLEITLAVSIALTAGGLAVGGVTFGIFSIPFKSKEAYSLNFFANKKTLEKESNILTNQKESDSVLTY